MLGCGRGWWVVSGTVGVRGTDGRAVGARLMQKMNRSVEVGCWRRLGERCTAALEMTETRSEYNAARHEDGRCGAVRMAEQRWAADE